MNWKIVYVGIDTLYQALPALVKAGCRVCEIVSCPVDNETEFNLRTCAFAKEHSIPLLIGKITREDVKRWKEAGIDALICCGYYYRIPVDEKLPMVNIHPALLPKGRGAWPMPVTLLEGLRESGITIHKMTDDFDEGDILSQKAVPVMPEDTLQTLTARLQTLLPGMMAELASDFCHRYEMARPQGEGEYWPCPEESNYPVTPDMDVSEADRILRAFYGYECIYRNRDEIYGVMEGRAYPAVYGGEKGLPVRGGTIVARRVRKL